MKLSEIKRSSPTVRVSIEPAGGRYGEFEVEVEYEYTPAETVRHGDNSTFDERIGSATEIIKAVLPASLDEYDEDGDKVVKTWPKGADVTKMTGWTKKDDEALQTAVEEKIEGDAQEAADDERIDRYRSSRD